MDLKLKVLLFSAALMLFASQASACIGYGCTTYVASPTTVHYHSPTYTHTCVGCYGSYSYNYAYHYPTYSYDYYPVRTYSYYPSYSYYGNYYYPSGNYFYAYAYF